MDIALLLFVIAAVVAGLGLLLEEHSARLLLIAVGLIAAGLAVQAA